MVAVWSANTTCSCRLFEATAVQHDSCSHVQATAHTLPVGLLTLWLCVVLCDLAVAADSVVPALVVCSRAGVVHLPDEV